MGRNGRSGESVEVYQVAPLAERILVSCFIQGFDHPKTLKGALARSLGYKWPSMEYRRVQSGIGHRVITYSEDLNSGESGIRRCLAEVCQTLLAIARLKTAEYFELSSSGNSAVKLFERLDFPRRGNFILEVVRNWGISDLNSSWRPTREAAEKAVRECEKTRAEQLSQLDDRSSRSDPKWNSHIDI